MLRRVIEQMLGSMGWAEARAPKKRLPSFGLSTDGQPRDVYTVTYNFGAVIENLNVPCSRQVCSRANHPHQHSS